MVVGIRQLRFVIICLVAVAATAGRSSAAGPLGNSSSGPGRWSGHWKLPPTSVPSSKTVDGPLLGDGETGAVLGVDEATGGLTAFISANSFWLLNTDRCGSQGHCEGSHRAGIGGVTLAIANATYRQQKSLIAPTCTLDQSLANGTVGFQLFSQHSGKPLLRGEILASQGSGAGAATTLITALTAASEEIKLSWSTWTFGQGKAISTGKAQVWCA